MKRDSPAIPGMLARESEPLPRDFEVATAVAVLFIGRREDELGRLATG